jgi:hypothetical protein
MAFRPRRVRRTAVPRTRGGEEVKLRLVTAGAGAAWESALVHANIQKDHR